MVYYIINDILSTTHSKTEFSSQSNSNFQDSIVWFFYPFSKELEGQEISFLTFLFQVNTEKSCQVGQLRIRSLSGLLIILRMVYNFNVFLPLHFLNYKLLNLFQRFQEFHYSNLQHTTIHGYLALVHKPEFSFFIAL